MRYYIHTFGCQMNVADSERLASALEKLGYQMAERPEQADVLVVNTCVVRRSAEEKAYGWLHMVRPLKERRPDRVVAVMGCLVGVKGNEGLRRAFPWVDVFMPPADPRPLVEFLARRVDEGRAVEDLERMVRYALQDEELVLPLSERGRKVTAYVPVVHGCSFGCTFCIIPYRRGPERSRPVGQVVAEVRALAEQGVREVTLLGQIVDRYGKDIPDGPDLADLLRAVHEVEGIQRIRFLTSHPSFMTDRIIEAVAELPKVCEHIEIPVQAGNDEVLARMRRGYTVADYKRVVEKIRRRIPNASIATDIIVGFCGETEEQFMDTYRLVEELEFDVGAHRQILPPAGDGGLAHHGRRRAARGERAPLPHAGGALRADLPPQERGPHRADGGDPGGGPQREGQVVRADPQQQAGLLRGRRPRLARAAGLRPHHRRRPLVPPGSPRGAQSGARSIPHAETPGLLRHLRKRRGRTADPAPFPQDPYPPFALQ
jgi:tRNA-2-methylthio-N6-dimethylallyladenosine synthase